MTDELATLRARVAELKADAGMVVTMMHARPDIWALCGFQERALVKKLCDTLNADWFRTPAAPTADRYGCLCPVGFEDECLLAPGVCLRKPEEPTPDPRDARIAVLEGRLGEVDDFRLMLAKLVHRLRQRPDLPAKEMVEQAADLLSRKGGASILRDRALGEEADRE